MSAILFGLFLGILFYAFTFIVSKRSGKYYLAPVITFLFSGMVAAAGIFLVGGFEGMGFLLIAAGFLVVNIAGTLLLPLLARGRGPEKLHKRDKIGMVLFPILFFATIGITLYADDGYWVIEKGSVAPAETEGYRISTISEGCKEVSLLLGKKYLGKWIEVDKVSKWGSTEITLKITDGGEEDKVPYIRIGIKEIKEPLKVETMDGVVFELVGGAGE